MRDFCNIYKEIASTSVLEARRGYAFAWLPVVATIAVLGGCAVGPDFQTPQAPPVDAYLPAASTGRPASENIPGQQVERAADVPDHWWHRFGSKRLNYLIAEGINRNADLQAAEAALRVAQANAMAMRGTLLPQVDANFLAQRMQTPSQSLVTNAASGENLYSLHTAQVSVAFVADVFGGVRRQVESADALAEAQAFQREGVYLTLTTNLALAAIQQASLAGQVGATRRIIALQEQVLTTLRRQYDQGQIALGEVAAQETALAQSRLLLPPLEKQLAQQRSLMAALTGHFPSEAVGADFQLSELTLPRQLPLSLPADLVRQRPDVRAAEANLKSSNALIGAAIANRLPQFTLTANAATTASSFAQLFTPGTAAWMLAGSVAQSIFDAGTRAWRQEAAEQAAIQASAQYRGVVLAAFQNVADVLRALQADARAVSAATAAESSARQSLDLVRRQVEQGQVSAPALLNAQQAWLQTSLALVQSRAARLADTVALFQALGGGWWNRPPPADVPATPEPTRYAAPTREYQ